MIVRHKSKKKDVQISNELEMNVVKSNMILSKIEERKNFALIILARSTILNFDLSHLTFRIMGSSRFWDKI